MHSILNTIKICVCATLMAIAFPMSVSAGSDEGMVEVTGSGLMTLEEIIKEEPDMVAEIQESAAEQETDWMEMAIEIKGNEVWFVLTYKESFPVKMTESVIQGLQEGLNEVGSDFSAIAGALDDAMDAEKGTVSIGIRLCDPDERVLAEADFRAE